MKTIKGTYRDNNYFEYEVNGKKYWVQGELYWNKAKKQTGAHPYRSKRRRIFNLLELLNKNIIYTVEISIDHSNFPDYMHFTLLKVENEERSFEYSSYNLETIIIYCVSNGIDVKELSFENKLVEKRK